MADWENAEIWYGQTPGGHEIKLWLNEGIGIWMDNVWRIEWSVSGATRKGESFEGEEVARTELDRIKTSIGLDWQQTQARP